MKIKLQNLFISLIIAVFITCFPFDTSYGQENINLITISVKDADLRDVIKMLSGEGRYNVVVGNDVTGKVTYDLHNVTIQDALEAALKINGYGIKKMG